MFFYREANESPTVGQDDSGHSQQIVAKMSEFDACLKWLANSIQHRRELKSFFSVRDLPNFTLTPGRLR